MVDDLFDLRRFVDAQAVVYDTVLTELRGGRKRTHWIWFVFPQLKGLGRSDTAEYFGLRSLDEAKAYLDHPVLGPRLRECARLLTAIPEPRSIKAVVGSVDALKICSSMTLFAAATDDNAEFTAVLDRYYDGRADEQTMNLLHRG